MIVGDSLMYQAAAGLECSWLRYGCNQSNTAAKQKKRDQRWKYGVSNIERWNVSCGGERADAPEVQFWLQYRPYEDMGQVEEMLSIADVFVFNSGLHYRRSQVDKYRNQTVAWLERVFKWASGDPSRRFAVWRETSAQHRDSLGGEWNTPRNSTTCVPLKWDEAHPYQWRDRLVKQWSAEVGFGPSAVPLHWIPFYDFTVHLSTLHPGAASNCDPSHYCQHPALWSPVWSNLTSILKGLGKV